MSYDSEAVTRGIRVQVEVAYSPEHSNPPGDVWFFVYRITIHNEGTETVQLVSRHWIITDGTGKVEEVQGPGVVGEQPILEPGDSHQYSSGCPLPTPFGSMRGSFQMAREGGDPFDAEVAEFHMREASAIH